MTAGVAALVAAVVLDTRADHHPPAAVPRIATPALTRNAIPVEVAAEPTGRPIPRGFVGLSTEYSSLTAYVGRNPQAVNPLFVRLIRNLTPGGTPLIRFGGDSTDWTWWPVPGDGKPPWARYVLTPLWISLAHALARAAHAQLILGINFEADSRALAQAESQALLAGIGPKLIAAFELGNEPEVYGQIGWYANAVGGPVLGRPPSYGFGTYLSDYRTVSSALPRSVPLAGPALALTWHLTVAERFIAANPRARLFTFHFYPLKRCFNEPSSSTYPTLTHLLAQRSADPPPGAVGAAAAAHSRGERIRVDEINSVSCKGLPGLSDSFASALWMVDALFGLARAGVDGVNIHTLPHVSYEPFAFADAAGHWEARVEPEYYGLLLFTQAAPASSRLLPTIHPAESGLRTWATLGPRNTERVVLINESSRRGLTLAVRPARARGPATLERLIAPGLTATTGVTLAGQSYGRMTATATLSGKRLTSSAEPIRGRYVVQLPPASAALLTLRASAGSRS